MSEGNNSTTTSSAITIEDVQNLVKKKDEIEEQIKAYYDVLEDQKGVGMTGPLVDAEGFPRGDIDVYQVRNARHNVACLQNDHKEIMQQTEEALYRLHAYEREKREKDKTQAKAEALEQDLPLPHPFAKVDAVTPGSPASISGLQVGDEIFEFGTVNSLNFQNLQNIASVVQHSEGKPLSIAVIRSGKKVHLGLTPQRWSGRGLLGCNILPLQR
ncbi:26S proteasome non-ATPase regulatory subunit 9-like [Acipenser ruthenus]|uniref:26S proteasome non-ATPase regulatory subunit 9-like n=1 Tax=Acipenser ruthenus TaxID=7906 RepID=UPI002740F0F5|nr:26S proteasome non-ATPase regulatory subunit 9-like [Acipenser ruthenus]